MFKLVKQKYSAISWICLRHTSVLDLPKTGETMYQSDLLHIDTIIDPAQKSERLEGDVGKETSRSYTSQSFSLRNKKLSLFGFFSVKGQTLTAVFQALR